MLVPQYFKVAANIKTLVIKSKLWRHYKRPSTIFICYISKLYRQVKNFQSEFNFDLQHVHVCIFEIKDGIQLKIFLMTYEEIYSAHHHCHRLMFMAWYILNSNIHEVFKEGVTMKLRF